MFDENSDELWEWYLGYFNEHLVGANVLYEREDDYDVYFANLFILLEQNGTWYRVDDVVIDACDPRVDTSWHRVCQKTSQEELLYAIDYEGLGIVNGKPCFGAELRSFLKNSA